MGCSQLQRGLADINLGESPGNQPLVSFSGQVRYGVVCMGHWIPRAWGKSIESYKGGPGLTDRRHQTFNAIILLLDIRAETNNSNASVCLISQETVILMRPCSQVSLSLVLSPSTASTECGISNMVRTILGMPERTWDPAARQYTGNYCRSTPGRCKTAGREMGARDRRWRITSQCKRERWTSRLYFVLFIINIHK